MKITVVKFGLLAGCLMFAGATHALAQEKENENPPSVAQVAALDECDPVTFNAVLGPDFCKNVALGAATKLSDLFKKAAAGTPDPGWDFEPDTVHIKKGTTLIVVDEAASLTLLPRWRGSVAVLYRGLMRQERARFPNVPAALRRSRWPRPESFKAAMPRSQACRRVNIFLSAASILGCA
jgi:hypothetical protein